MKRIILLLSLFLSKLVFSQVIIGGASGSTPNDKKAAVLLEFENGLNKGIILPYVRTLPSGIGLEGGTMLLDSTDPTKARVKYYAPGNPNADRNGWVNLSQKSEANLILPTDYMQIQPTSIGVHAVLEDLNGGVIIGSETSNAKGVLILESTTRSLILPKVSSTDLIKNPAPGMVVYLNGVNKRFAVFNGAKWTFWAP